MGEAEGTPAQNGQPADLSRCGLIVMTRCRFEGCHRSTDHPHEGGWSFLCDWGPGVKDGFYCPTHGDALEALNLSGELEDVSSDDDEDG
jgi:hypothetical protein